MKFGACKKLLSVFLFAAVLVAVLVCPIYGVASAATYGGKDAADLWYFGEGALNLAQAKQIVDGWDKSKLPTVVIAISDTGVDTSHELFEDVLYKNDKGQVVGYNSRTGKVVDASGLADHEDKHGNSVTGVAAMLIKELGLQNNIKIYPIKSNSVDKNGNEVATFNINSLKNAINHAKDIKADILNLSFSVLAKDDPDGIWIGDKNELQYTIDSAARDGMFIVAAAGNAGLDSEETDGNGKYANRAYPASSDNVFAVMSYDKNGSIISNYGSAYDIAAPGKEIYTASDPRGESIYKVTEGTSMASPIAAVTAALLKLRYAAEGKTMDKSVYDLMRNLDLQTVDKKVGDAVRYKIKRLDLVTVLTQDFDNTVFDYLPPVAIGISHDGPLGEEEYANTVTMYATRVRPVSFIAKFDPERVDPDIKSLVEWVLRTPDGSERVLATGETFVYDAKVYGKSSIIARLPGFDIEEKSQDFFIEYGEYYPDDVRVTFENNVGDGVKYAPSKGVIYTGEKTVFSLTGIEYVDPDVNIRWFVNDVLVAEGEGMTKFEYTPSKTGKQIIAAQYGDRPKISTDYVFSAEVRHFIARPLDLSMLIIGIAIVVVAIALVTAAAVKRKKGKTDGSVDDSVAQ